MQIPIIYYSLGKCRQLELWKYGEGGRASIIAIKLPQLSEDRVFTMHCCGKWPQDGGAPFITLSVLFQHPIPSHPIPFRSARCGRIQRPAAEGVGCRNGAIVSSQLGAMATSNACNNARGVQPERCSLPTCFNLRRWRAQGQLSTCVCVCVSSPADIDE